MSTATVRIQTFPNNEVRAVFFWAYPRKEEKSLTGEGALKPLLDITSKLQPSQQLSQAEAPQGNSPVKEKPGYGGESHVSGFTLYGRRKLLRAGGAMENLVDSPEDCLFLTGTLPGSTYESKRAIAAWSAYAVNLVNTWVSKRCPEKLSMYVWEFQKRGALHLHYAVVCKSQREREYILKHWKQQWSRVIDAIGVKSGVDMWRKNRDYTHANDKSVLQADAQVCRKSVANYLAKYISKSQAQYQANHWSRCKPSRYWGISRALGAALKSQTETVEWVLGSRREWEASYEDCLSVMDAFSLRCHHYGVRQSTAKVIVGYSNPGERQWLIQELAQTTMREISPSARSACLEEALCLRIQRSLLRDERLRSFVQENSERYFCDLVRRVGSSESLTLEELQEVITTYRWYIARARTIGRRLSPLHVQLTTDVENWYQSKWGQPSTRTPRPVLTEQRVATSEKNVNLQLTVLQRPGRVV